MILSPLQNHLGLRAVQVQVEIEAKAEKREGQRPRFRLRKGTNRANIFLSRSSQRPQRRIKVWDCIDKSISSVDVGMSGRPEGREMENPLTNQMFLDRVVEHHVGTTCLGEVA